MEQTKSTPSNSIPLHRHEELKKLWERMSEDQQRKYGLEYRNFVRQMQGNK